MTKAFKKYMKILINNNTALDIYLFITSIGLFILRF